MGQFAQFHRYGWLDVLRLLVALTIGLLVFLTRCTPAGAQPPRAAPTAQQRDALLQELVCQGAPAPARIMGLLLLKVEAPAVEPFENLIGDASAMPVFVGSQVLERGNPFGALTLGKYLSGWQQIDLRGEQQANKPARTDQTKAAIQADPRIPRGYERQMLDRVVDGRTIQSSDVNFDEHQAFELLLLRAHDAGATLAKFVRRDLLYANLMQESKLHRGAIVHIRGVLHDLRAWNDENLRQQGIDKYYEGWIADGGHLYCVFITELPPGLEVGEKKNTPVSFDGYFFKRMRYSTNRTDKKGRPVMEQAPALIGATLRLPAAPAAPADEADPFTSNFVLTLGGLIGGTVGLIVLLTWWFRRGDRRVESRVAAVRHANVVLPSEDPGDTELEPAPPDAQ
jgi:hypothetical protein